MNVTFDPDIGRCDDCGSEDGVRRPTIRTVTISGAPAAVQAWLCAACWPLRRTRNGKGRPLPQARRSHA